MPLTAGGAGFPLAPAIDSAGQALLLYLRFTSDTNANIEAVGYGETALVTAPPSVTLHLPPQIAPQPGGGPRPLKVRDHLHGERTGTVPLR